MVRISARIDKLGGVEDPDVVDAMSEEIQKWKNFQAYELVEDKGQDAIDSRWVVTEKDSHDGMKVAIKARLCLTGFKETAVKISTNILYAFAGNFGWRIESVDATSAFLQWEEIDREILVRPPIESGEEGHLWRMKKAAYGLIDASRRWFKRVMKFMIGKGGQTLTGD